MRRASPAQHVESSACFGSGTSTGTGTGTAHHSGIRSLGVIAAACLLIVLVYRWIPQRIRRMWSFGQSTSHIAAARLRSGELQGSRALLLLIRMAVPHISAPWVDRPDHGAIAWDLDWQPETCCVDHQEFRPVSWRG